MKIKFVNGVAGYRGAMVKSMFGKNPSCGYTWTNRYDNERGIIVVRQRSDWFTILIFIHELAHYINNKLFKHALRKRINIWIDKYMIRRKDKRGGE